MSVYFNLGCGRRYVPDTALWTNIDFVATGHNVVAHDLRQNIPAPDASVDLVYHSHVLEHFTRTDGERFIGECFRVLKPGGVLRVAVPDLEQIVRAYLQAFESESPDDYDWTVLELYDQAVRTTSGGDMARYLAANPRNRDFILGRCGLEVEGYLTGTRSAPSPRRRRSIRQILLAARHRLGRLLLGGDARALSVGQFRLGGEVHQWMYDRYSLGRLLARCGFVDVVQRTAAESYVPHWSDFNLDTEPGGRIYKPDSLFMEARKPL